MKKAGRILVGLIAASMAMGSVASVSAATAGEVGAFGTSGGLKGTGALEGNVNTQVIKVVLPTNSLNFTIDPVGLIKATNGAKLKSTSKGKVENVSIYRGSSNVTTSATDDGAGIFFTTIDEGTKTATLNNTTSLVITNKSSVDVQITPTIAVTGTKLLKVATAEEGIADATDPMIKFSMTYVYEKQDGNNQSDAAAKMTTPTSEPVLAAASAAPAESFTLEGAPGNYVKVYSGGKYQYVIKPDVVPSTVPSGMPTDPATAALFRKATFDVVAECSSGEIATWSKVTDKPALEVTWKIEMPTTETAEP